jgi:hypothetical protein
LIQACRFFKLQTDVRVTDISEDKCRWTLEYKQDPEKPDFANHMMKVESLLQKLLRMPVDLRLETKEDKMKRRERNVLK